ncbi:lysophospholipid acyltransferase family protein [Salaquimonas pukyongi]|uniref:lysophospholipid acyltransferase family protein n=1 Tax=Salaquimonas pukyongi TaxID=2712698 RepID=UPI00096B70C9|nr:lysophospholipid acyltransferase family protein [Salaquimonas pukyongi]
MTVTDKPNSSAAVKVSPDRKAGLSTQPHQMRYNPDGSGGPGPKYLRTEELLDADTETLPGRAAVWLAEKVLGIGHVNAICRKAGMPWPSSRQMIDHLFREFSISWKVSNPEMFDRLEGKPAVFVGNHPYGMADAFAMNNMLETHRPNFKLFANSFLTSADSITHKLLFVDPFMNEKSRAMNRRSMMSALKHLKEGGDLALFPGRLCSHLKWGQRVIQDGEWTDQVRIFVEAGGANLVPVHVSGRNSWRFQAAGLVHPKLRTLLILREFIRGGHDFSFTLGEPVPAEALIKAGRIAPPGQIARALTYATNPRYAAQFKGRGDVPVRVPQTRSAAAAAAVKQPPASALRKALADWPVLVEHGALKTYNVRHGMPESLKAAIARVRFDAYAGGASVASPLDLIDEYDRVYSHLVLWDEEAGRIAGSYRYIIPSRIEGGVDLSDLVSASIFHLKQPFVDILPQALELGRAAISEDYQRSYAPLMMMWRGIMDILRRDKSLKYLIGPVTIPQSYSPLSRHVLKRFLEKTSSDPSLFGYAAPRKPFTVPLPLQVEVDDLIGEAKTVPEIGCIIEALEGGERKLPVLYRQYANVGLKYVATGEWPELDHAMASLAVLDLSQARRDFVSRYLGKENAEEFFEGR